MLVATKRRTINLRNPATEELPKYGAMVTLVDGRHGWIAGAGRVSGKLLFVQLNAVNGRSSIELWPAEFRGFQSRKVFSK